MFFKKNNKKSLLIYQNIVEISRSKVFYIDFELDDSFETRFDLITMHSFIIFYYYRKNKDIKSNIAQELFDLIFGDLENNLREMGFGDIAVNKKMKSFVNAFYGRIAQYSKSMELYENKADKKLLHQTILNNIYKEQDANNHANVFVSYIIDNFENFNGKNENANLKNNFLFNKILNVR
tara:strand:- start:176 stop:712 length:537 start_codon:yes stop_codon:yes gene_type:complete